MKVFKAIVKIAVALAAAAGAVYVVATYGEEIVDRAKKLWGKLTSGCNCCCTMSASFDPEEEETEGTETAAPAEETAEAPEAAAEEAETASEPAAPAEEAASADDAAVTADEADFEG